MRIEVIARLCHEVNRAYCAALGDVSHKPWDEAPDWQRQSVIAGVRFLIGNPDAGPDASHKAWLAHKEAEGWKHGPVKDEEKKEHPCFVPYDKLPPEQRAKDYLFQAIVRTVSAVKWIDVNVSPSAAAAVRHRFNPSARGEVDRIKDLAGTLVTMLEEIRERDDGRAVADAQVAIRHVQTASMWSVFAATVGA